jgi:hypothetical protein
MSSSYTNSFEKENVTNSFQYAIMITDKYRCASKEETLIYWKKCYKDLNAKLK